MADDFQTVFKGSRAVKSVDEVTQKRIHKFRRQALRKEFFEHQVDKIKDDFIAEHVNAFKAKNPEAKEESVEKEKKYWLGKWLKMCNWACNDEWMEERFELFVKDQDPTAAQAAWIKIDLARLTPEEQQWLKKDKEESKESSKKKDKRKKKQAPAAIHHKSAFSVLDLDEDE